MNSIPLAIRNALSEDPFYKVCARKDDDCRGRITWEHALTYAGRQLQEPWAIVPLCVWHHLAAGLNKEINRWIALRRATEAQAAWYGFQQLRKYLIGKYGER